MVKYAKAYYFELNDSSKKVMLIKYKKGMQDMKLTKKQNEEALKRIRDNWTIPGCLKCGGTSFDIDDGV